MLRAGWLALFVFVWLIGAFLGATFEHADSVAGAGQIYSTGTATFTYGDATVVGAGGAAWVAGMEGGNIKSNTDNVWYRIDTVTDGTHLELAAVYSHAGGAGHAYTMAASPGWPGTSSGTGGYSYNTVNQQPIDTMEYLINWRNAMQRIPIFGGIPVPVPNVQYFETAFKVLTWQWNFVYDEYPLIYWIVFSPFVVMGVLCLILLVYGILTGNLSL